ncbi:MAG: anti-sigma factor family protein, partial [Vicinamibacterales bacterium]
LAFETEAMPHVERLFRHAMWLARDRAEAEDLVHGPGKGDTLTMECRDVRELADSFLSEQLLVETNHELLRHLETCPSCRAEIGGRRALRDRLRSAFTHAEDLRPRPEFAAELLATLQTSRGGMSRRSVLRSWWTLAAGVAFAAGGGLFVRGSNARARLATLAREAAGDHQHCAVKFSLAERPIRLEEAGRRYGGPYAALATFDPSAALGPLELLDRHACVYQGRRFGHVVFRHGGALTSLLVTDGAPPPTPELELSGSGPSVASLPAGRYLGFVVADVDQQAVLRLAQALAQPLSQHFA